MFQRHMLLPLSLAIVLLGWPPGVARAEAPIQVVVTSSAYDSIARYLGEDKVSVSYIVKGYQDPHVVRPKPSLAVKLNKAAVFVATGR